MTDKSEANTADAVEREERDETNYNPEAFEPVFKKYELEEKLLEKLRFKTDEDKYVFDRLPLLPTQKLEIVYQLIVEDNDCVECDKELKEDIKRIIGSKTE